MSEMDDDRDLAAVIELEQRLLEPEVRRDRAALAALLHEDLCEFGASGRVYDRESIIEVLLASDGRSAKASDFKAIHLGSRAVLVTYQPTHRRFGPRCGRATAMEHGDYCTARRPRPVLSRGSRPRGRSSGRMYFRHEKVDGG